ncbi:unnamed protein product [Mucor hiemalis]
MVFLCQNRKCIKTQMDIVLNSSFPSFIYSFFFHFYFIPQILIPFLSLRKKKTMDNSYKQQQQQQQAGGTFIDSFQQKKIIVTVCWHMFQFIVVMMKMMYFHPNVTVLTYTTIINTALPMTFI